MWNLIRRVLEAESGLLGGTQHNVGWCPMFVLGKILARVLLLGPDWIFCPTLAVYIRSPRGKASERRVHLRAQSKGRVVG